jgi:hypothetical protein
VSQTSVTNRFTQTPALAAINPQRALKSMFPINLGPSVTIAKGNLLVPPSGTGTNDVQTITAPGSGNYILTVTNPLTGTVTATTSLAAAANDATVQAAINVALGSVGSVTVSSLAVTFGGALAKLPIPIMTTTAGSVAHTTVGVSPGTWTLYAGSGSPTVWLEHDVATDTSGQITLGAANTGGPWGEKQSSISCFYAGDFFAADIPNLDAGAMTALGARNLNTQSLSTAGTIVRIP